ncbi:MAG: hypothetical protein QOD77_357 [Thermoplasmata archaeon]|jgi:hypothetical protein|nr:hypothetical protein [Thermoplasmata archaeon]
MKPVDLKSIMEFRVGSDALQAAQNVLQQAGSQGVECLVLLAGKPIDSKTLLLDMVYVPEQHATALSVRLSPGSLIPIHQDLADTGRLIAIQIHTHPGHAFHSDTDDADDTVTQEGSISIVVPCFGRFGLKNWPHCVGYIRDRSGWGRTLESEELSALVKVHP